MSTQTITPKQFIALMNKEELDISDLGKTIQYLSEELNSLDAAITYRKKLIPILEDNKIKLLNDLQIEIGNLQKINDAMLLKE